MQSQQCVIIRRKIEKQHFVLPVHKLIFLIPVLVELKLGLKEFRIVMLSGKMRGGKAHDSTWEKKIATRCAFKKLYKAASKGNLERLKYCLAEDTSHVNRTTSSGYSPLYAAVRGGHLGVVEELLKNGADVNDVGSGQYLINAAASYGYKDIVGVLFNAGADISGTDFDGETLLHAAARSGCWETFQIVFPYGIDVNSISNDGSSGWKSG